MIVKVSPVSWRAHAIAFLNSLESVTSTSVTLEAKPHVPGDPETIVEREHQSNVKRRIAASECIDSILHCNRALLLKAC